MRFPSLDCYDVGADVLNLIANPTGIWSMKNLLKIILPRLVISGASE